MPLAIRLKFYAGLYVGRLSVPHSRMLSGPAAAVAGISDNRRMHLQCGDIVEFPVYK